MSNRLMTSGILGLLFLARVATAQGQTASPPVTPLTSLPITRGAITYVAPNSPCPPYSGRPVRVGSGIAQPPVLKFTPPRAGPSSGRVLVEAMIRQDGTVGRVKVLRGPDDLHQLALDAVKQWKFARTCLNGMAVPIIHVVAVTWPGEGDPRRRQ